MKTRSTVTNLLLRRTFSNGSKTEFLTEAGGTSFVFSSVNGDHVTPNNQSYDKRVYRNFSGTLIAYYSNGSEAYRDSGCMASYRMLGGNPTGTFLPPAYEHVMALATSRFYSNLRQSNLNIAQSIGEAAQTRDMLKDTTDKVTDLARRARKKAIKAFRRGIPWYKAISRAWLSYQYGWRPLLSDIFGLVDFRRTRARRFTVSGTAKGSLEHSHAQRPLGPGGALLQGHIVQSTRVKMEVTCQVSNTYLTDYSRITSMNPIGLAWEFFPLSFVADWFTGLGNYLEQLEQSYGNGLTFLRGYRTRVSRDVYRTIVPPQKFGTTGGATYEVKGGWIGRGLRVVKVRERLSGFPPATLPQLSVNLGAERLISAAALITQLFRMPKLQ